MENNKKEDIVFVSFDRLWDNFKKFWWIAALLTVVLLIYGAGTYNRTIAMSETEGENYTPVVIPDNESERVHLGTVALSYSASVEKYLEYAGISNSNTDELELYQKLCNDVIVYAQTIISSQSFYDAVDSVLVQNGYDALTPSERYPADTEYDQMTVAYVSDMNFQFAMTGLGGQDRINLAAATAAQTLAEQLTQLCPFIVCEADSNPTIELRVLIQGFFCYYDPSDESIESIRKQYENYNQIANDEMDRFDFSVSNLFQVSTMIKGVVGFVIGLFIIFVIAVCDKKVRTREELERFFEGEGVFLGEIKKKNSVTKDVTAVSITEMCIKHNISKAILTTVGKQKNGELMADLSVKASVNNVSVVCADGIEVCPETTKAIAGAEGTIVMVNSGFDDVHTIKNALSRIHTVDARMLGYILCK